MSINDVAIEFAKGNDYIIHFWYISNDEAKSDSNNVDLNLKSVDYPTYFLPHIKIDQEIIRFGDIEIGKKSHRYKDLLFSKPCGY